MRIAFSCVCDSAYVYLLRVLLKSVLKNNPGFSLDWIVFHDIDFSRDDMDRLTAVYPVKFRLVDKNRYDRMKPFRKSFYKFESFLLAGYDRVISLDVDTMCMAPLGPVLNYPVMGKIGLAWEYNRGHSNTGIIVIDRPFLDPVFWKNLMSCDYSGRLDVFGTDQRHLTCHCREKNILGTLPPNFMVMQTESGRVPPEDWEKMIFFHMIHKPLSGQQSWYENGGSKRELEIWKGYYQCTA